MSDDHNDDEQVGYGRPPQRHRFKPGQSGNPRGRPKGSRNHATILEEELDTALPYLIDGKRKTIPARRLMLRQAVHKAAKGELKALQLLSRMIEVDDARRDRLAGMQAGQTDSHEDQILAELLQRIRPIADENVASDPLKPGSKA